LWVSPNTHEKEATDDRAHYRTDEYVRKVGADADGDFLPNSSSSCLIVIDTFQSKKMGILIWEPSKREDVAFLKDPLEAG
jgi:hypothetical protein